MNEVGAVFTTGGIAALVAVWVSSASAGLPGGKPPFSISRSLRRIATSSQRGGAMSSWRSEAATAGHAAGERFVLLNPAALVPFDAPAGSIGGTLRFKAVGPGDVIGGVDAVTIAVAGRALRPLSPVDLRATRDAGGDIAMRWTRRSRQGFDWIDGTDAPLGEESERYAVEIGSGGTVVRRASLAEPGAVYSAAEQIADFGSLATDLDIRVVQVSALTGPGDALLQHSIIAI